MLRTEDGVSDDDLLLWGLGGNSAELISSRVAILMRLELSSSELKSVGKRILDTKKSTGRAYISGLAEAGRYRSCCSLDVLGQVYRKGRSLLANSVDTGGGADSRRGGGVVDSGRSSPDPYLDAASSSRSMWHLQEEEEEVQDSE